MNFLDDKHLSRLEGSPPGLETGNVSLNDKNGPKQQNNATQICVKLLRNDSSGSCMSTNTWHSGFALDLHATSRGLIEICKGVQSAIVYASQKGTLPGSVRPLCFLRQNRMEKRTRDEPSIPALLRSSALRRSDLHCLALIRCMKHRRGPRETREQQIQSAIARSRSFKWPTTKRHSSSIPLRDERRIIRYDDRV